MIPTFRESAGYAELRQVLSPRWFVAGRYGFTRSYGTTHSIETSSGFRPDRFQLLKVGYELEHDGSGSPSNNRFGIQLITTFHRSANWK
jgi:hypothetical protein